MLYASYISIFLKKKAGDRIFLLMMGQTYATLHRLIPEIFLAYSVWMLNSQLLELEHIELWKFGESF